MCSTKKIKKEQNLIEAINIASLQFVNQQAGWYNPCFQLWEISRGLFLAWQWYRKCEAEMESMAESTA
jgi:hypothetical protein